MQAFALMNSREPCQCKHIGKTALQPSPFLGFQSAVWPPRSSRGAREQPQEPTKHREACQRECQAHASIFVVLCL